VGRYGNEDIKLARAGFEALLGKRRIVLQKEMHHLGNLPRTLDRSERGPKAVETAMLR
jgi:hypothetical protein